MRGKVLGMDDTGDEIPSTSTFCLGVRSSSWFSEIVSPISTWPPKLRYGSSNDLLRGLRLRPGGPSGLEGLTAVAIIGRPPESEFGNERVLVICGADKEMVEDLDRRWDFLKGEVVRGRYDKLGVRVLAFGNSIVGDAGTAAC